MLLVGGSDEDISGRMDVEVMSEDGDRGELWY